jgi:linoleate 10R-lipoxygenase
VDEAKRKLNSGAATVSQSLFSGVDSTTLATYFSKKTEELFQTESFKHVGKGVRYVDIVKDVINLIPVHYISEELVGLIDFLLYAFFSDLLYRLDFR